MKRVLWSLVCAVVLLCQSVTGTQWTCPLFCHCVSASRIVNCSLLALTSLPDQLVSDALNIDVSHNAISSLSANSLSNLTAVQQLDFSFNPLTSLASHTFSFLSDLHTLRMHHCGLHDTILQNVHWAHVRSIDLSDNNMVSLSWLDASAVNELILNNNRITVLTRQFLSKHPMLRSLNLAYNGIKEIVLVWGGETHGLYYLDLSHNAISRISSMSLDGLTSLLKLNLAHNHLQYLPTDVFARLYSLQMLWLAGNNIISLPDSMFSGCTSLISLDLSSLVNLTSVGTAFDGLLNVERLSLAHCPNLQLVVTSSLSSMPKLGYLDLSHSSVTWLTAQHLVAMPSTLIMNMTGNPWSCDCQSWPLLQQLLSRVTSTVAVCTQPLPLLGQSVWDSKNYVNCSETVYNNVSHSPHSDTAGYVSPNDSHTQSIQRDEVVYYKTGSSALLVCSGLQHSNHVQWSTPNKDVDYNNAHDELSDVKHSEEATEPISEYSSRVLLLANGSLAIREVQRQDAGLYTCRSGNFSGETYAIHFRLDYDVIFTTKIESMLFGAACASLFLVIGIFICFIRYISFRCSDEERQKRQSIKQLLERIQDYKTEKMERFSAYRTAKIGQISAYRTAKMDQLSAYRTAKMDQLFAFKTAKLGRLRTYKQMTMTNILHHMDRMREHYAAQSSKVKVNCAHQARNLHHKYRLRVGRFKDYRSHQIDRLRDNYHSQMTRIHEYGSQQMDKLREQYRSQQQYIVKLMELLDIGNCIAVVDAECRLAETIIFDPTLPVPLELDEGQVDGEDCDSLKAPDSSADGDEYMTASIGEPSLSGDISLQAMEDTGVELAHNGSLSGDNEEDSSVPTVCSQVEGRMEAGREHHADFTTKFEDEIALSNVLENSQLNESGSRRVMHRNGSGKAAGNQVLVGKQRTAKDTVLLKGKGKQKDSVLLEVYLDDSERMARLRQQRQRQQSAPDPSLLVHHCVVEKESQCTDDACV